MGRSTHLKKKNQWGHDLSAHRIPKGNKINEASGERGGNTWGTNGGSIFKNKKRDGATLIVEKEKGP